MCVRCFLRGLRWDPSKRATNVLGVCRPLKKEVVEKGEKNRFLRGCEHSL